MAVQIRCYDFRMSETRKDGSKFTKDDVGKCLLKLCKKFVFQLEKGEKNDYVHYQGRISLIKSTLKKTLLEQFCNILKCENKDAPQYLEPTTKGVHKTSNFNYVLKEATRVDGPWTEKDFTDDKLKEPVYIPRQYRDKMNNLYPFQKQIKESGKVFNDRDVNLILSNKGCDGKTTIAHICRLFDKGLVIPTINDAERLVASVCDICMAKNIRDPSPLFFDMPRAMSKDRLFGIYSAIESIKSGYLYDLRNKYKEWDIDSPQIWVFCNELPDLSLLSLDRWKIWKINDKKELERMTAEDIENEKCDAIVTSEGLKPLKVKSSTEKPIKESTKKVKITKKLFN